MINKRIEDSTQKIKSGFGFGYYSYGILLIILIFLFVSCFSYAQNLNDKKASYITTEKVIDGFKLSYKGHSAPLFINYADYPGVMRVIKNIQTDIKNVTGANPQLYIDNLPNLKEIVIVGTLGKSQIIDEMIKANKLNVTSIEGKWEAYQICVIERPFKDIDKALVIVGSDKRGTIYGMYDLAEKIGVSPWNWWADVPVKKHSELFVLPGHCFINAPEVKYRGIFINDEAPALSGWVSEKFGGFNHKFYEHVFDLILRLKGNFLWPAMWGRSFYTDDTLNPRLADEYGVVIGTSHHEPLMRAHVEWGKGPGTWNYQKNEDTLKIFWTEGIRRMNSYESVITLGMRGDGDEPMSQGANIDLLQGIVKDQRKIIGDVTGKDVTTLPQVWALYKEVQEYYDKGMRVPDDVTLLLCDDNWGNIRKLPNLKDKPHEGGYGIYYHFDYVGDPRNYKWLNTNQTSRVWEQMHLAYEYGVNKLWIVNVGDIKPMEFPIDFFMNYVWNPDKLNAEDISNFSVEWAEKQFGNKYSKDIAEIMNDYTRFNSRRKPELLSPSTYSLANFREFETVVDDYKKLLKKSEKIYKSIPKEYKDAFYQLILHPVKACANINEMYYLTAKNHLYAEQGRAGTNKLIAEVNSLFKKDSAISYYYNKKVAGGKWDHMMDQTHISYSYWQQPEKDTVPKTKEIVIPAVAEMGVAIEGSEKFWPMEKSEALLPEFDLFNKQKYYVEVFNRGSKPYTCTVETGKPYVKVNFKSGKIDTEKRLWVSIDWEKAPSGKNKIPIFIAGPDKNKVTVYAQIHKPAPDEQKDIKGFIESNGYVSIEAEHHTNAVGANEIKWQRIPLLGRTLSGMTSLPTTFSFSKDTLCKNSPRLEYEVYLFNKGDVKVKAYLSPTLNFPNNQGLRYAISFDDETPQIINMHSDTAIKVWEKHVADNINIQISNHQLKENGKHILKFWLVDPGIVLQKLVIGTGEEKPSYLGPPESIFKK